MPKSLDNSPLVNTVRRLSSEIALHARSMPNEQDTKATLIEPVLDVLGWDTKDRNHVRREYKRDPTDDPVDYALMLMHKPQLTDHPQPEPRLLVEAKRLGEPLTKWVKKLLFYAYTAEVGWCVLTNGDEYRLYNAHAKGPVTERLLARVRLSADPTDRVAEVLAYFSRANLQGNLLDHLWTAQVVQRKVNVALDDMFQTQDGGLVELIQAKIAGGGSKLEREQVIESLRQLKVLIEPIGKKQPPPPVTKVELVDLIEAGRLAPQVRLFRTYRGKPVEARLLPDGRVEFGGQPYRTCSLAAERARQTITGRRMSTNGWAFWQLDVDGQTVTLESVRAAFLKRMVTPLTRDQIKARVNEVMGTPEHQDLSSRDLEFVTGITEIVFRRYKAERGIKPVKKGLIRTDQQVQLLDALARKYGREAQWKDRRDRG